MTSIKETVDLHTQLAGKNRFEMLLFRLSSKQRFGINVFKVKEVVHCMDLTQIPERHPAICGIAKIRELTVPVIDLSLAVNGPAIVDIENGFIIVTEYNNSIQGFLVSSVDKIINLQWDQINPPPVGLNGSQGSYLTAVTNVENEIIEILDVEKVLQEITPVIAEIKDELKQRATVINKNKIVIVIDDSTVARNQITRTLQELGIKTVTFKNGKEALVAFSQWQADKDEILSKIGLIVCDVEMPEMDGYTFTANMKRNPEFKGLFIVLHTSLSGAFNKSLIEQVGADKFVSKFEPNVLAAIILDNIK